jgi:GMP synthase-like glutamine amidotransferase
MILIVDNTNGDKTVYFNDLLGILKDYIIICSSDTLDAIDSKDVDLVILSGSSVVKDGEEFYINSQMLSLNKLVIQRFIDKPIIGICYGCQLINYLFGGSLEKLHTPYCDKSLVNFKNGISIPIQFCFRYYMDRVAPSFKVLAETNIRGHTYPIMICHKYKSIYGMIFHAEQSKETCFILKNLIYSF